MNYLLKKEDRTVTISKTEDKWNYRKEFGSVLIDNFNFTEDKLAGYLTELESIGYKIINGPQSSEKEEIIEGVTEWGVSYKSWMKNGKYHREDGPAIEYSNGEQHWYVNGLRHREDGPAVIGAFIPEVNVCFSYIQYRYESWYKEGKLHREGGPAVTYVSGDMFWWENDNFIKRKLNYSNINSIVYSPFKYGFDLSNYSKNYYFNKLFYSFL